MQKYDIRCPLPLLLDFLFLCNNWSNMITQPGLFDQVSVFHKLDTKFLVYLCGFLVDISFSFVFFECLRGLVNNPSPKHTSKISSSASIVGMRNKTMNIPPEAVFGAN